MRRSPIALGLEIATGLMLGGAACAQDNLKIVFGARRSSTRRSRIQIPERKQ